jgi:uncharacterized protein (TIRG00374 family)
MRALWRRATGSFWIRLAISLGLLAAVLTQIDVPGAVERLADGRWWLFIAATGCLLTAFVVGALRWHLFLGAAQVEGPWRGTLEAYFAGVFTSNVLPTSFGGDVVRAWIAGGPGRRSRAGATVVVDRVTVLACALALAWLAVLSGPPASLIAALAAATGVFAFVIAAPVLATFAGKRFRHRLPSGVTAVGREAALAGRAALSGRRLLVATTVLGLVYEALTIVELWLAAKSVDVDLSLAIAAITLPPMLLLSALPISIGGLGVREVSYVALLAPVGIDATEATLVSLLAGLAFALASLPGAFVLLRRSRPRARDLEA